MTLADADVPQLVAALARRFRAGGFPTRPSLIIVAHMLQEAMDQPERYRDYLAKEAGHAGLLH